MNCGVKRFHASVHHFRKAGKICHVLHVQPCLFQELGGATRGDEFDTHRGELLGLLHQSGLVRHGKQGAANANGGSARGGICHVGKSFGAGFKLLPRGVA